MKLLTLVVIGALCAIRSAFAADQVLGPWTWHDVEKGLLWTFNGTAFGNNDQDWQVTITGVRPYDADKAVTEVEIPAYVGENGQFRVMQFGNDNGTAVFTAGCTNVTRVTFAEDATEVIPTYSCMRGTKWWKDHCSSVPVVLNDTYLLQFTTNTVTADQKVTVPSSVKVIGVHAGSNCGQVKTLEFAYGAQVERIGRKAFDGLGATELAIPDTVTRIDTIAFGANVRRITFGKGLEKLDRAWFWEYSRVTGWGNLNATALADITMGDGMTDLPLDVRYRTNGTEDRVGIFEDATPGNVSLTNIVISKEVASIGDRTFWNCTNLAQVKFGGQEERIGDQAFRNTTALKTIEIPNSVTEIGVDAFNSSGLEKLTFAKDTALATIGRNAFNGCTKLGIVALPDALEAVSDGAFSGCTSLSNLVLGAAIAYIGRDAFRDCGNDKKTALIYVSIPDSVVEIYEDAFNGCTFLTNIVTTSSSSLEVVAGKAFAGTAFCGRKEGSFNMASIGSILVGFNGVCEGRIEVPDGIVQIHDDAFHVPAGETNRMTTVVLPSTVEVIGANAFQDCKSLATVEWGGSERIIGNNAFQGCAALTGLELPGSLERIGANAFQDCGSITKVEIPDGLETVEGSCFLNCSNLTEVAIGVGVRSVGANAFNGCERMKTLEFLNNDTFRTIGTRAFRLCKELKEISLPDSTFAIRNNAFEMCSNLTEVAVGDTLEYVGRDAFKDTRLVKSSKLVLVGNVLVGYDSAQIRDRDEIEIEDGVVSIAEDAFRDCGLGTVVIPESVKWIFNNAFANCSNLWKTVIQNPDVQLENDPAIKKNGTLFSTTIAVTKPGYTFQGGTVGGAPPFDGDGVGGLNLAMLWLNLAKITFRTDPEGDGDFVAGESYTGWLKTPWPQNAMVGTITVKTSKPDKLGRVKIVATVTMNGVKKVFTESVVPENGKAEGIYSLHGLKLGGKWLDGTLTYAGHQYVLEGGVSVAKTEPARFDAFNKHVWALRFTSGAPVGGYPGSALTVNDAPLARGDCTLTVQPSGKGKVKVSGILGDGTKVSATAQMVAGDGGANCAAVSIPLYAGKRGGFSFLLWFYVNEDNKPVAYVDETYDCAANWVFPVDFGKEAFVYVPINIASGAEVDVNDKVALRWPDRMAFRVGGFAGIVYDEIKNLEINVAELEKDASSVDFYSEAGGGYNACYRQRIRVTANEKGKWECAKAPKFKFSVAPDESSSVVSALDAAGRLFGQVAEGKYVKIVKGTDGLGNGWNPVTDVGTRPDYNGHGVRLGYLLIDEGTKPDKSGNLATNLSGLKLSYKPKTGMFNGSYEIQSVDVSKPESPKLKKTKVAVNGVVIDGLGYGTAVIKGVGSQTCSIVVDR